MLLSPLDDVTEAVDGLMLMSEAYGRGQCIPWEEVERIAGSRRTSRGVYVISKWQRRMEDERSIVTLCAKGVGVRLLTDEETAIEIPALRQRKAYRQIRRAIRQTAVVNVDRLSDASRRVLALQRANMADQRRDLLRSQRQLEKRLAPVETNPRRKVPA